MNAAALSWAAYCQLSAGAAGASWLPALRFLHWQPGAFNGAWLQLGLDPLLARADWPRHVTIGGVRVPLRCVASGASGVLQAAVQLQHPALGVGHGSLGALLQPRAPGDLPLALTAGHVLGGGAVRRLDTIMLQLDGQPIGQGQLQAWVPALGGPERRASLDAGVVGVGASTLSALRASHPLPAGRAEVGNDQALWLLARGRRLRARARGRITAFMRAGAGGSLRYLFEDGLCYQVDEGSEPGDSGAPIWDAHDRLVAIHTGSLPAEAGGNALATPIQRVLRWFGAELYTRGEGGAPAQVPAQTLRPLPPPGSLSAPARESAAAADTLARTMWGEARGEGEDGMGAVAHVVFNRRDARSWWGRSIEAICHKPYQFSCWNRDDPNLAQLLDLDAARNVIFASALGLAERLLALPLDERVRADTTRGATHYHRSGLSPLPNWARGQLPCERIGKHVFYRGIA